MFLCFYGKKNLPFSHAYSWMLVVFPSHEIKLCTVSTWHSVCEAPPILCPAIATDVARILCMLAANTTQYTHINSMLFGKCKKRALLFFNRHYWCWGRNFIRSPRAHVVTAPCATILFFGFYLFEWMWASERERENKKKRTTNLTRSVF